MNTAKLLLFDLDGTLLRSDKSISQKTLWALQKCREQGYLVGISTSRAAENCVTFLSQVNPDILIASGGAVIQYQGENIYTAEFTEEETLHMIDYARAVCGADCEIAIDTLNGQYWNYKVNPNEEDATWGNTIYTDFINFTGRALKFTVKIFEDCHAEKLRQLLPGCDCARFEGGFWYKFTKTDATKERALQTSCRILNLRLEDVTAFGDDIPDIGMLRMCGTGIAMGNAHEAVKKAADMIIGSNNADGIAEYLKLITP